MIEKRQKPDMKGKNNPNWRGGPIEKICAVCGAHYSVKPVHSASRYCSLQCVGVSQRNAFEGPKGRVERVKRRLEKNCAQCGSVFQIYPSQAKNRCCCSKSCSFAYRSKISSGERNPAWKGGLSRLPYPYDFNAISRKVIAHHGGVCQSPKCRRSDSRMTTHHVDYNKLNCDPDNLIALCSSCNTRANFGRPAWTAFYTALLAAHPNKMTIESFD